MNDALREASTYMRRNHISPAPHKLQLLHVGGTRARGPPVECEMDGQILKPDKVIKVLGVLLDEELAWEAQADAAALRACACRQVALQPLLHSKRMAIELKANAREKKNFGGRDTIGVALGAECGSEPRTPSFTNC